MVKNNDNNNFNDNNNNNNNDNNNNKNNNNNDNNKITIIITRSAFLPSPCRGLKHIRSSVLGLKCSEIQSETLLHMSLNSLHGGRGGTYISRTKPILSPQQVTLKSSKTLHDWLMRFSLI